MNNNGKSKNMDSDSQSRVVNLKKPHQSAGTSEKNNSNMSLASISAKSAMSDFFRMSESATEDIGEILNAFDLRLCVAESCTGGLLGAAITQVGGVSSWFEGGFITYSNTAKNEQLGVDTKVLEKYGAVSALTVCQMAAGACRKSGTQIGVSISGIAGPSGAVKDKPVGTVWIGLILPKNFREYKNKIEKKKEHSQLKDAVPGRDYSWLVSAQLLKNAYFLRESPALAVENGEVRAREFHFEGDRTAVRQSATLMALYFIYEYLS